MYSWSAEINLIYKKPLLILVFTFVLILGAATVCPEQMPVKSQQDKRFNEIKVSLGKWKI